MVEATKVMMESLMVTPEVHFSNLVISPNFTLYIVVTTSVVHSL